MKMTGGDSKKETNSYTHRKIEIRTLDLHVDLENERHKRQKGGEKKLRMSKR